MAEPSGDSRGASRLPLAIQLAALAAWTGLAAVIVWRFAGRATDDIYITYRYAQNLAAGHGFVFNPGERVFGLTDPGVGLLLAVGRVLLGLPIPTFGTFLTGACLLVVAFLLLQEGTERGRIWEAVAGGLLLVTSAYVWIAQGAGPLPALTLLLAAARLAGRGEARRLGADSLAGLLAGLAVVCRPDAAVGAGLLALLLWRERRRLPVAFCLATAGVVLVGAGAAWAWFGAVIPNTLLAKRQFAALNPRLLTGPRVFWGSAWSLFRTYSGPLAGPLLLVGALGQLPLFARGGRAGRLLVLHSAALALAYTVLRVPFFVWYTVPTCIALLYGAAYGGGELLRRLLEAGSAPLRRGAALVAALALAALAVSALLATAAWWREGGAGDWRLAAYSQAGEWIRGHSAPGDDLSFDEVGILAYTSDRPVQDLVGLVTPRSLPYVAVGDFLGAFLSKPSEYVVFHTFSVRGGTRPIVSRPWFPRAYELVQRFDRPDLGGSISIFRRRPGAPVPPPRPPHAHAAAAS